MIDWWLYYVARTRFEPSIWVDIFQMHAHVWRWFILELNVHFALAFSSIMEDFSRLKNYIRCRTQWARAFNVVYGDQQLNWMRVKQHAGSYPAQQVDFMLRRSFAYGTKTSLSFMAAIDGSPTTSLQLSLESSNSTQLASRCETPTNLVFLWSIYFALEFCIERQPWQLSSTSRRSP